MSNGWASGFMILTLPLLTATAIKTMEVIEFSQDEIRALLKFIEFHTESFCDEESAEELNEIVGCNVDTLYEKIAAALTY